MFCSKCGKEMFEDDAFCPYCGMPKKVLGKPGESAPAAAEQKAAKPAQPPEVAAHAPPPEAAAPTPTIGVTTPPPGPPPPAAPPPPAKAEGKPPKKWLVPVVCGAAALVIVAVVLILVFAVFTGGGGPEGTVRDYYKALENRDVSAILAIADTDQFKGEPGSEEAFKKSGPASMPAQNVKIEGLGLDTAIDGNEATVKVTKGILKYKDENGQTVSRDIEETGGSVVFSLVKKDGKWYLGKKNFAGFWAGRDLAKADEMLEQVQADYKNKKNEAEALFTGLEQGVTSYQQLDQKYKERQAKLTPSIDALIKKAEDAKSRYDAVNGFEDVEPYKRYARVRINECDDIIKVASRFKDFLNEVGAALNGMVANPPASGSVAQQAVASIENRYVAEIDPLEKEIQKLDDEAEAMKKQLGL